QEVLVVLIDSHQGRWDVSVHHTDVHDLARIDMTIARYRGITRLGRGGRGGCRFEDVYTARRTDLVLESKVAWEVRIRDVDLRDREGALVGRRHVGAASDDDLRAHSQIQIERRVGDHRDHVARSGHAGGRIAALEDVVNGDQMGNIGRQSHGSVEERRDVTFLTQAEGLD